MLELEDRFGKRVLKILAGHMRVVSVEETITILEEIGEACGTINQVFDADRIAGEEHLIHAARLALNALEAGKNFATSPSIELACWTAGSRQISLAIDRVGIREDTQEVAVVILGGDSGKVDESRERIMSKLQIDPDRDVLEITEEKIKTLCKAFSISKNELEVAPPKKIVLERVALLSLQQ